MSETKTEQAALNELVSETTGLPEERLSEPHALRELHERFGEDDAGSRNRALLYQMVDFVPPWDAEELRKKNQQGRFNINYGLAATIKNEAMAGFLQMIASPERMVDIKLNRSVPEEQAEEWGDVMAEEFTTMVREWDNSLPSFVELLEEFVVQGVAITTFDDHLTWKFTTHTLEECKFPKGTKAVPNEVSVMSAAVRVSPDVLIRKMGPKKGEWDGRGWNPEAVKRAVDDAVKSQDTDEAQSWNFEKVERESKANQLYVQEILPKVKLIYGWVREYDGSFSLYVTTEDKVKENESNGGKGWREEWLYRERRKFRTADEMFQIFTYALGRRRDIQTIRGLVYMIYEPCQADNVLRSKLNDVALAKAGDIWQSDTTESDRRLEMTDFGAGMMVPPGVRRLPVENGVPLDKSVTVAIASNREILDRHSRGLSASRSSADSARKVKLEVQNEMANTAVLRVLSTMLFVPAYTRLLREMVRRAFTKTQADPVTRRETLNMRARCVERGVPEEIFDEIDYLRTTAYRSIGDGSKEQEQLILQRVGEMFSSLDPQGQDNYVYDMVTSLMGNERGRRYKARPGTDRGHVDMNIAQLENYSLLEGDVLEPIPGENRMVHLKMHIGELQQNMQGVEKGEQEYWEFAMENATLFNHATATLQQTTVHETLMPQLKAMGQALQQIGELVENGLKQAEKLRQEGRLPAGAQGEGEGAQSPQGSTEGREQAREQQMKQAEIQVKQAELQARLQKAQVDVQKAMITLQATREKSQAEIAILQQKAINDQRKSEAEIRRTIQSK